MQTDEIKNVPPALLQANVGRSVNQEYADLVYAQQELTNKKQRSVDDENKLKANAANLTKLEMGMSSQEIIMSVRYAFRHIPPRI